MLRYTYEVTDINKEFITNYITIMFKGKFKASGGLVIKRNNYTDYFIDNFNKSICLNGHRLAPRKHMYAIANGNNMYHVCLTDSAYYFKEKERYIKKCLHSYTNLIDKNLKLEKTLKNIAK